MKKLAGETNLAPAAAKLTSREFVALQSLLDMVHPKEPAADAGLAKGKDLLLGPLKKGKLHRKLPAAVQKKLQKKDHDVSTDPKGFPTMFASSKEASPCKATHPLEKGQMALALQALQDIHYPGVAGREGNPCERKKKPWKMFPWKRCPQRVCMGL